MVNNNFSISSHPLESGAETEVTFRLHCKILFPTTLTSFKVSSWKKVLVRLDTYDSSGFLSNI